ncbi:solute carrier family 25 member 53-like [Megalops cyprinoides]|uniref:solute carrier family 25 member 53-like n=1 Tax=Megalops cyprinoides TaxID=118141 RepID=UPI0018655D6C|nr:solute carrier family 25 member 53-like [Megalops cyprinoides]
MCHLGACQGVDVFVSVRPSFTVSPTWRRCAPLDRKMQRSPGECDDGAALSGRDPFARLRSYMHGGTSSLLSTMTTLVTFPVYKTVFRQQLHSTLVREAVAQLYKEGPRKLYRGVVPPFLVKTLHGTLLFGLQDTFLHQLCPEGGSPAPLFFLQALAGVATGVVEALVFTPFERVQNVLQNAGNDRALPTLRSVLLHLRAESLAAGFYRAALPILLRNALGNGLYFGLKDPMRDALGERGLPPVASSFASGMVNSMAISLPLYPLSVLVANMQAQVGGDGGGVRRSWAALWESRQRSVALLYRGGSLVILRSCLTWGITTAIYDRLERRAG